MNFEKVIRSRRTFFVINFVLLFILVFSLGANQVVITQIYKVLGLESNFVQTFKKALARTDDSGLEDLSLTGKAMEDAVKLAISAGLPEIYGAELGVSFNEVQAAIEVLKQYDPTYGPRKITLTGDSLERYINIGLKISCEYCCGAKSIISSDGQAACGCAHSWAMRGLLAYLLQNHPTEYTDDEMLRELARWKALYFPKQMIQKLANQLQGTQEFTADTASLILGLALTDYVGNGQEVPLPSEVKNLPGMVGGC